MRQPTISIWVFFVAFGLATQVHAMASSEPPTRGADTGAEISQEMAATTAASECGENRAIAPIVESDKETIVSPAMPVYIPPFRGAPEGRLPGGTRGPCEGEVAVYTLAPGDHVGLTVKEQPSLFWSLSEQTNFPIEFTFIEHGAVYPILKKRLPSLESAGVQRIRLADYGVRLEKGVRHEWVVTLVPAPDSEEPGTMAGAAIERIAFPETLDKKLKAAGRSRAPHVYGEAGLWYDALSAISDLIENAPGDGTLREQRDFLLKQVGLPEQGAR